MTADTAVSGRRERKLGWITPNAQRFDADRAADWLDAIRRQVCPICGAGPFTVVATHVAHMHAIDRLALRAMVGLDPDSSICDPAHSKNRSALSRKVNALTLDVRREALHATWEQKNAARDAEIVGHLQSGLSFVEIEALMGISRHTVRAAAHRQGFGRVWGVGTDRVCEECGRGFKVRKRSATGRFCCRKCSNAATADVRAATLRERPRRPKAVRAPRTCAHCGEQFIVERLSLPTRFCSSRCANSERQRRPDGTFG